MSGGWDWSGAFDAEAYFHARVNVIRDAGLLTKYKEPKVYQDLPDETKVTRLAVQGQAGTSNHPGDPPYTAEALRHDPKAQNIPQGLPETRHRIVTDVLSTYFPARDVSCYTDYFVRHSADCEAFQAVIKQETENFTNRIQTAMRTGEKYTSSYYLKEPDGLLKLDRLKKLPSGSEPRFYIMINSRQLHDRLQAHPELALAAILFRAAQHHYSLELERAFNQYNHFKAPEERGLSETERAVGRSCLMSGLKQFRDNNMNLFFPNLTLAYYKKLTGMAQPRKPEKIQPLMESAISEALKSWEEKQLLVSQSPAREETISCPARFHVRQTLNDYPWKERNDLQAASIKGIYTYISSHREQFQGLLDQVSRELKTLKQQMDKELGSGGRAVG